MRTHPVYVGAALMASAVVLLAGGSVALAQETGPGTQSCADAIADKNEAQDELRKAERADKDLKDAEQKLRNRGVPERVWDDQSVRNRLREARDSGLLSQDRQPEHWGADRPVTPDSEENTRADRELSALQDWTRAKDNAKDTGRVEKLRDDARDAERRADDVCGTPSTTPTTPPPPFVDLNCGNFPLPDGTTAQQMLDRDRTDPHGLDADSNGIACDVTAAPDPDPAPPIIVVPPQNVISPSGGVQTGGGPA